MGNYFTDRMKAEDVAKLQYLPTIVDLMEKCRKEYADLPAISDKTTTYTYSELYSRVARRRAFLKSLNIPAGSNVAVMSRNNFDAMELYLAVTTAGYTLIMLPVQLNAEALAGISRKFELKAMLVNDEFKPLTENVACPVYSSSSIGDAEEAPAKVEKKTVAAIYFTGGTTGAPKGVVLTHGALMRGAYNGIIHEGNPWNNVYIAVLPLSHIFGSVFGFLSCLYTGSLIYGCHDPKAALGDLPVVKPTKLILVPGLVEIIFTLAKMKGDAFLGGRIRTIACGAAPVPARLRQEAKKWNINFLAGYGLTEGANLTAGNMDLDTHPDSVGHIYPEQEYKLVNGELWIKGDNVMEGYYKNPEETAKVMEDGWLKTGDLARIDDDGFLYITGRIKNLIILSNGENVSPEELEDLLLKNDGIRECLVKEMQKNGNTVIGADIFLAPQAFAGKSDAEKMEYAQKSIDSVNAQLPDFKQIRMFTLRQEEFKKTGTLKVDRLHS